MQLSAITARLSSQVTALKKVEVSASLDGILQDTPVYPSAYLLSPQEKAGRNEGVNYLNQRVEPRFSIAIRVQSVADMRGEAALAEIDTLKPLIRNALLNWLPTGSDLPIELVGGRLLYAAGGEAIWADEFLSSYFVRAT